MNVIKFGGTSVGTVESFKDVIKIIASYTEKEKTIVVISALGGITNKIITAIEEAENGSDDYLELYSEIKSRHFNYLENLIDSKNFSEAQNKLELILTELKNKLDGVHLLQHAGPKIYDSIVSIGELLSQTLLVYSLKSISLSALSYNAKEFIKTDSNFGDADILFDETIEKIRITFIGLKEKEIAVVNGFTGSNKFGETTTLGRSGSDYTATIIGAALKVQSVDIWTDVDGVFNADPQYIPSAENIPQLSYDETIELSSLGAKVIFPKSVLPVKSENIPIKILNTFNPSSPGTVITSETNIFPNNIISITSLEEIGIVTIPDIAGNHSLQVLSQITNLLSVHQVALLNVSQNYHNRSITLVAYNRDIDRIVNIAEFIFKNNFNRTVKIEVLTEIGIVSVLTDNYFSNADVLNRSANTLVQSGIQYRIISNYNSRALQFLVKNSDVKKTVTLLHNIFFSKKRQANVA